MGVVPNDNQVYYSTLASEKSIARIRELGAVQSFAQDSCWQFKPPSFRAKPGHPACPDAAARIAGQSINDAERGCERQVAQKPEPHPRELTHYKC
jgi:hypothetical protein